MGATEVSRTFLDDGSANWGNQQEHKATLVEHRTSDTWTYLKDGEEVFHMDADEIRVLIQLCRDHELILD